MDNECINWPYPLVSVYIRRYVKEKGKSGENSLLLDTGLIYGPMVSERTKIYIFLNWGQKRT